VKILHRHVFWRPKRWLRMSRVTWPVGRGSKMTKYLEFLWPYCLLTSTGIRWRLGTVSRWNFYTKAFLAENFKVRFLVQFLTLGKFFMGLILTLNFLPLKRHTLEWDCVVWAIARENPPTGLTCRRVIKRSYMEKNLLYFTHLPRSP